MNRLLPKGLILSSLLTTLSFGAAAADAVPAFPGAEGHARYTTTGGRGGKVYHVSTLEDDGAGSLRWALAQSGTKTIVFDVSGYIDLKSDLKVSSNTTIAGQTAPDGGITLRYYTLQFSNCSNVIVRFIRSRRSQVRDINDGADASWGKGGKNIILDHCSFSWSIDEVASFYDNQNFTMQWCNVTEGLANPGHSKGAHSYGGIWGGKNASFHHNYISHVQNRAPRFNGARYMSTNFDKNKFENTVDAERVDFRNCVVYNWGTGGCYGGPGGGYINMVNNYYKAGPGTTNKNRVTQCSRASSGTSEDQFSALYGLFSRYYINGNYVVNAGDQAENYDWKGVVYDGGLTDFEGGKYIPDKDHWFGKEGEHADGAHVQYQSIGGSDYINIRIDDPVAAGDVTTHDAQTAYEKLLLYSGASLWRDDVDARYAEEARTGTTTYAGSIVKRAGILDVINDPDKEEDPTTASYPELPSNRRSIVFDNDNDGIPDQWERQYGLDPDRNDANKKTLDPRGWYTNLEVYLNSLVQPIVKAQNADALEPLDEYYPLLPGESLVETVTTAGMVAAIEYYSLDGRRIAEPDKGICIRRIVYTDGTSLTDKVIK